MRDVSSELLIEERNTLFTPRLVSNWNRQNDLKSKRSQPKTEKNGKSARKTYFVHNSTVIQGNGESVSDVALVRIVVLDGELLVFNALDL